MESPQVPAGDLHRLPNYQNQSLIPFTTTGLCVWVHAFSGADWETPVWTDPLPTIRVRFIPLNSSGPLRWANGAFVPEGRCDRSLARSAWNGPQSGTTNNSGLGLARPSHHTPTGRFSRWTFSQAFRARLRSCRPSGTRPTMTLIRRFPAPRPGAPVQPES